jgi:hypothetical protein
MGHFHQRRKRNTILITHIFKYTNPKIAYNVNNTIESLLKAKPIHYDKYSACGI